MKVSADTLEETDYRYRPIVGGHYRPIIGRYRLIGRPLAFALLPIKRNADKVHFPALFKYVEVTTLRMAIASAVNTLNATNPDQRQLKRNRQSRFQSENMI